MKTLYEKTHELLLAQKGHWRQICDETRLDYNWLTKFAQKKISDPGVKKVQALHDYLEGE